jgi:hypothetical protein
MSDGKDLRAEKLTDRKHELRRLLSKVPESRMTYADHIEREGIALFQRVSVSYYRRHVFEQRTKSFAGQLILKDALIPIPA